MLDEIARIREAVAIVAHISTTSISDRLLRRWVGNRMPMVCPVVTGSNVSMTVIKRSTWINIYPSIALHPMLGS